MSQPIIIQRRDPKHRLSCLRNHEIIPGVLYGQSLKQSIPIQLPLKSLQAILSNVSKSTIFTLELDGEPCNCILRAFQPNKLHSKILHVDFQVVKKGETIKMNIPVIYEGIEMLSSKKLVLEKNIDKLSVRGPVENLPEAFILNVGALNKGDKILAQSVSLPPSTEILMNSETILATIQQ